MKADPDQPATLPVAHPTAPRRLLPLGALAAGFGLMQLVAAQPETTMQPITVKAQAETDATSIRAASSSIGKGTQDIRDIPQSLSVMTEKLLDDRKLTTLKEALHHVAGISFAAAENGTDQDIRIRGFPVATVGDLFIDGMRDPSQYERDTFNTERVEVLRGSASMLFGRGSTGGVVNQVSKKPQLSDETEVQLTIGSGDLLRGTLDFNHRTGETSGLRISAMNTVAHNGGARIDKQGLAPSFSWGVGSADEFNVSAFYLNANNVPRPGIGWLQGGVPAGIKAGDFYGFASDQLLGRAANGTLSQVHQFGGGGGELKTQLRQGSYDRQLWSSTNRYAAGTTQDNLNAATLLTRAGLTPRKDRYGTTYLQSDYSNSFNACGLRHEVLAGVDAAQEKAARDSVVPGTNPTLRPGTAVGTPDDGSALANTLQWRPSSDYSARSAGVYVQDLQQLSPSWKLLAGVRWDRFKGDFSQTAYSATNVPTRTATTLSNSLWSYRSGVLFQPTETASFHFSYATSFNTSADTYQFVTALTANTPPEKSRNLELGAKLDWLGGKLSTRAALFRTEKYNERNTDLDSAGSAYLLSGARYAQGLEVDVVGKPAKDWEVYLSLSYVPNAEITQAADTAAGANTLHKRVGLTPKASGSVWLSHQATAKLRLAAGFNGSSRTYPLTVAGANSAGPWVVADAMAEYQLTPDLRAQLNVTNIANRTYGDQLYPGFVVLGEPRKAQLTLAFLF